MKGGQGGLAFDSTSIFTVAIKPCIDIKSWLLYQHGNQINILSFYSFKETIPLRSLPTLSIQVLGGSPAKTSLNPSIEQHSKLHTPKSQF